MASANRLGEWAQFLGEEIPESLAERRDGDLDGSFEELFDASGG